MSKESVGFGSNRVLVSLPPCELPASVEWAVNIATQYWPLNTSREFASQEGLGDDPDVLRNYTAGYALATKCRYVWFLSNSILPPNWAVSRMLEVLRSDPNIMVCAGMEDPSLPGQSEGSTEDSLTELIELSPNDHVGFECTLVKTELFSHIPEPWFKSTDLVDSSKYFSHRVIDNGYKIYAHPGVLCGVVDMKSSKSYWPSASVISKPKESVEVG